MSPELEKLQASVKRTYSFKYKPEFSESFKATIDENHVIPLIIEVFEKLEWPIVYRDDTSVEAKRGNDFNNFSEKIKVTKKPSGHIEVHSKSINGNFIDFGRNSKRTGLFVALFKKLEQEYHTTGKLEELETALDKQDNWTDYEVPTELPKPKKYRKPNLVMTLLGGFFIAIIAGGIIGFLTANFTYIIGLYEFLIGIFMGYLFGKLLTKTHYMHYKHTQWMIVGMVFVMFIASQYTQYQSFVINNASYRMNFFEFMQLRFEAGLTIRELHTGWIGLLISWILQIFLVYLITAQKAHTIAMAYIIQKIPEKVIEYVIYLFDTNKSESEVRAELSNKGWNKKTDQDDVFEAIGIISAYHQQNRE